MLFLAKKSGRNRMGTIAEMRVEQRPPTMMTPVTLSTSVVLFVPLDWFVSRIFLPSKTSVGD